MAKKILIRICLCAALIFLGGCGETVTDKTPAPAATPSTPQTGDTTLFPNSHLLASAESLLGTTGTSEVSTSAAATAPIIIDTRGKDAYDAGHIPGAINVEWTLFVDFEAAPDRALLKPVADLETLLGGLGMTRTADIVIYDDTVASWGAAGRIFWMLEVLGCPNVQILNGGWDKWDEDGLPMETTPNTLDAVTFTADTGIYPNASMDKDYINSRTGDTDFVVVDTRTDEEYNGWTLYDEARGGHIPGAVHLPYADYYNDDYSIKGYSDLDTLLEAKGVTPDKEVVAYCTAGIRSGFFYFLTRLMGYGRTANYDGSMWEWAASDAATYPMDAMPRYDELVHAAWVQAVMDYRAGGIDAVAPDNYSYGQDHKFLIFETQWGSFDDMDAGWADRSYLDGHIPGAIHSNSDVYENGFPRWFVLDETELKAAVGSMGITADTTVVVYSSSPIFATRLWWILKYAGVADVRILNGGMDAWTAMGGDVETDINEPVAVTYDGTLVPAHIATTDYVATVYDSTADTIVADVRTWAEYIGQTSGYSYVVNKGRIPGAVWAFNADNPDREYLDDDGTMRSYTEVLDMWAELGIEATLASDAFDKEVIFYCGSGYRSSLAYLYAYLMGYDNAKNYSDGWEGWSTDYVEDENYVADPDTPGDTDGWQQNRSVRPVATGDPGTT